MRKPFYKANRDTWYCEIERKQIVLAKGKDNKAEAEKEFHKLMAGEIPVTSRTTVASLVADFLAWTRNNREPRTAEWYRHHCESFVAHCKGNRLKVGEVRPYHVTKWMEQRYATNQHGKPTSDSSKNGAVRAVARAFNWARKQGLIAASPIAGMERPAAESREEYLSVPQWLELIALLPATDPLADLITFLWETGARPHEARIAEAKHFSDGKYPRITLERKSSKGKKHRRVIHLEGRALEIVRRLAKEGPIFRNNVGKPWAKESLVTRFKKLSDKLGYRVIPYMLRHGFCTRALENGVDPLRVSILMGHRDTTMVMRTYQHLSQNDKHLRAGLRQALGDDAA